MYVVKVTDFNIIRDGVEIETDDVFKAQMRDPGASEPSRECIANALRAPGAQPSRARLAPLGAQAAAQ
jgi:hypothetical protein